jgi:hypothetical protein
VTRYQKAISRDQLLATTAPSELREGDTTTMTQPNTGSILTPKEASAYLWANYRLQRSERRLAQLRAAPVGSGPPYHRDGCTVRYRQESLDTWAMQQLGREHGNTSDESAFNQQRLSAA